MKTPILILVIIAIVAVLFYFLGRFSAEIKETEIYYLPPDTFEVERTICLDSLIDKEWQDRHRFIDAHFCNIDYHEVITGYKNAKIYNSNTFVYNICSKKDSCFIGTTRDINYVNYLIENYNNLYYIEPELIDQP